jgi:hypothetical protein
VLLTRSPLVYPRKGLTARLACVKHAASVRPEPGSNSPTKSGSSKPRRGLGYKQTGIKPIHDKARHTVEFSKDTRTPSTTAKWHPGLYLVGCSTSAEATFLTYMVLTAESSSARPTSVRLHLAVQTFRGGRRAGGLTLGRSDSVPVCRAARRGDLEKVTQVPQGPSHRGSVYKIVAGQRPFTGRPPSVKTPRRPPARRRGCACHGGRRAIRRAAGRSRPGPTARRTP